MNFSNSEELKEDLKKSLDETFWEDLRPHIVRGTVLILAQDLDLIETAFLIASDDKEKVQNLVVTNKINKPNIEEINSWEQAQVKLRCLIVKPFVLVQEFTIEKK